LLNLKRCIILSDRPLYLGIEPSECCSKDEFLKKLEMFDINALDALLHGRVIYDDGFWLKAREKGKEIMSKHGLSEELLKRVLAPI
jgi:hypothetical protein